MTTIEDLYYGNIVPCERGFKRGSRTDELLKLISRNETELDATLTEKQREIFDKVKDCMNELSCITEREAFKQGFVLATRIMIESISGLENIEDI